MNGTFKINGGMPLNGTVTPIINKNSLMGALPLCALNTEGITFSDLPATTDVECFLEIFRRWGARIETQGAGTVIDTRSNKLYKVDADIGRRLRGAFSLAGPLLARFGRAEVPLPGGCKLGTRAPSVHVDAFKRIGVNVIEENGYLIFTVPREMKKRQTLWLLEASVTATLNIAMFAAGSDIDLEIIDAACEPHVSDVLRTLVAMGADIEGIGTNILRIKGNPALKSALFNASPDHVDIAGYCVAAALTKGTIRIKGANRPLVMDGIINWLELFGIKIVRDGDDLVASVEGELVLRKEDMPQAGRDLPKFVVRPWPGFPVDILPVMVTLATKTHGAVLFQNWMYESGFDFVRELNYLGAEIYMSDPQRIIVFEDVINFKGGEVAGPGIIQGTMAIFLAALSDRVETVVHGTDILRRRYPNIFETYQSLGARIEKL